MSDPQDRNKDLLSTVSVLERPAVTPLSLMFAPGIREEHLIQLCRVEQENEIDRCVRAAMIELPDEAP